MPRGGRPQWRSGGGRGGSRRGPDQVRAPYNFVPLAKEVVRPEWGHQVSQDVPFRDARCGWLDVDIDLKTPTFIRGTHDPEQFFEVDGQPAIPGTSLRGMLRTVVEIASFSRMGQVNDHRFGYRDLRNRKLYLSKLQGPGGPLSCAGWLELGEGFDEKEEEGEDGERRWKITPCSFAKLGYELLQDLARDVGISRFDPGWKQSAAEKYKAWGDHSLEAWARVDAIIPHGRSVERGPVRVGDYGRVSSVDSKPGYGTPGTVVFTGQPTPYDRRSPRPGRKRHDFFFHGPELEPLRVPYRVRRNFCFIHSATGEQHRNEIAPNEEWKYFESRLKEGGRVPVFFLPDEKEPGQVKAVGLAMMFRLAYEKGPLDLVKDWQDNYEVLAPDLAELLFGRVRNYRDENGAKTDAQRGRVSIETAAAEGSVQVSEQVVETVLGAPKASYYPSYIRQENYPSAHVPRDGRQPDYRTYEDEGARVRGWKRYPQRLEVGKPIPAPRRKDGTVNKKVLTHFRPLSAGRFRARIHVHGLRQVEFGALLWAIDFGGEPGCRHGLGLAKSLGYGGVTLSVSECVLEDMEGKALALGDLATEVQAFESFMRGCLGGSWKSSDQIRDLVAMAKPLGGEEAVDLRSMTLEPNNEFQDAKGEGLALPPPRRQGDDRGVAEAEQKAWSSEQAEREAEQQVAERAAEERRRASLSAEDRCFEELQAAEKESRHLQLMNEWREAGGEEEAPRRLAARRFIGKPSAKWKKKNAALYEWTRLG
ncbi:MAG: TIGR03986 family CRISPR-associated RAMP protein [Acidobacteriota bacterium]